MSRIVATTTVDTPISEPAVVDGIQAINKMLSTAAFLFGQEGVIMPPDTLPFVIKTLIDFLKIKSQGQPGFPFDTHPKLTKFSITCLLMFVLASVAEHFVSGPGFDPNTSVFPVIARLGKNTSLYSMVASLACLCFV
ncbi:hypothetical protein R6Q59_021915 [Mikania micrantha]